MVPEQNPEDPNSGAEASLDEKLAGAKDEVAQVANNAKKEIKEIEVEVKKAEDEVKKERCFSHDTGRWNYK